MLNTLLIDLIPDDLARRLGNLNIRFVAQFLEIARSPKQLDRLALALDVSTELLRAVAHDLQQASPDIVARPRVKGPRGGLGFGKKEDLRRFMEKFNPGKKFDLPPLQGLVVAALRARDTADPQPIDFF